MFAAGAGLPHEDRTRRLEIALPENEKPSFLRGRSGSRLPAQPASAPPVREETDTVL